MGEGVLRRELELDSGQELDGGGRREIVLGFLAGLLVMVPLTLISV